MAPGEPVEDAEGPESVKVENTEGPESVNDSGPSTFSSGDRI